MCVALCVLTYSNFCRYNIGLLQHLNSLLLDTLHIKYQYKQ